jgi:hypothetical protein
MISLAPDKSVVVEADFGPMAYLSATRLKTWQECRLKWYFRYVEEIPTVVNPALFIGQLTHHQLLNVKQNPPLPPPPGAPPLPEKITIPQPLKK